MSSCTFFGHADAAKEIEPILWSTLKELIEKRNVSLFYVGNHGCFDQTVANTLRTLKTEYPKIRYCIVLAYLPTKACAEPDHAETIFPEGLEQVPKRYAIAWRNQWMIEQSDYVVTFVLRDFGGAAAFQKRAEKKGKRIINLSKLYK